MQLKLDRPWGEDDGVPPELRTLLGKKLPLHPHPQIFEVMPASLMLASPVESMLHRMIPDRRD